jgi:hypothetical protein
MDPSPAPAPSFVDTTVKGTRAFSPGENPQQQTQRPPQPRLVHEDLTMETMRPPISREKFVVAPSPQATRERSNFGDHDEDFPVRGSSREDLRQSAAPFIREELAGLVREAVQNYCDKHFNELARDIILHELRRLADEKSKFLAEP